jgi:hypothetical protein
MLDGPACFHLNDCRPFLRRSCSNPRCKSRNHDCPAVLGYSRCRWIGCKWNRLWKCSVFFASKMVMNFFLAKEWGVDIAILEQNHSISLPTAYCHFFTGGFVPGSGPAFLVARQSHTNTKCQPSAGRCQLSASGLGDPDEEKRSHSGEEQEEAQQSPKPRAGEAQRRDKQATASSQRDNGRPSLPPPPVCSLRLPVDGSDATYYLYIYK